MSKEPLRTCLGCNKVRRKRELLRIVKTSEGQILVDLSGKASGRGGYLCLEEECLKKALKGEIIAKALKVKAEDLDKEELAKIIYKKAGLKNGQERTKTKRNR